MIAKNIVCFQSRNYLFLKLTYDGLLGWKWHLVRGKNHFIFLTPMAVNQYIHFISRELGKMSEENTNLECNF